MSQRDATALLERLVGHDTVSARSNLGLIDEVADLLDAAGARVARMFDETGSKANLFATIGPDAPGGVALSGHTDVVPVDGQSWSSDPFRLTRRDGRLVGRGAADMKGFLACALALVAEIRAERLRRPIHFALSYDEEVGCVGVRGMLAELGRTLPRPGLVVVGEPTGMAVVHGHKGIRNFTTTLVGRDGHSSRPAEGVNAIRYAAEIVAFLDRMAGEFAAAAGDSPFDPKGTTLNVGVIAGGSAVNMIAGECRIVWEFRPEPGFPADEVKARLDRFVAQSILPRMRALAAEARVETVQKVAVPPFPPRPDSEAVALLLRLTGAPAAGVVAFTTEAGLYDAAGIPAVVCGPGRISEAHRPDEFVTEDQLARCTAALRRLLAWAEEG